MLTGRYLAILRNVAIVGALAALSALTPVRATTVWTNRNDNTRSGAVLSETVLNQSNVNQNTFGYLFTCPVDNSPTQPLYVPNVMINGALHNVMYVGTNNNSMYAFDADTGTQLKYINYGTAPSLADMAPGCYNYTGAPVGITDTPVIDTTTNTMYFVARNKSAGQFTITLHAIDLGTFAEKFNGPETLTVSAAAINAGGSFDPQYLDEHAALTLANGTVYLSFCSAGDCGDYRGWILGYQASNIAQQQFAFSDVNIPAANAPNYCFLDNTGNCVGTGNQAGIWMSSNGFAVDSAGNVYLATGNGAYDGSANYGDTILKMLPSATSLTVQDWFTPSNQATLAANDYDVGAVGVVLLPDGKLVGGCKDGRLFLVNPANMGKYSATSDKVLEEFQATTSGADSVRSTPVLYNSPVNGTTLYLWPNNDGIKAFQYAAGLIKTNPVATNSTVDGIYDSPLSISANGSASGTGIVWASESNPNDNLFGDNTLYAFNADNLSLLYDSNQDAARDAKIGSWVRFTPPTIADGRVFVPSVGGLPLGIAVYGLLAGQTPPATTLTANGGNTDALLTWTASAGATSYAVYRATVSGAEQAPAIAPGVATTGYTDAGLSNGTTYYYTVTAAGSLGTSVMSNEASATPTPQPTAPTSLTPTAEGGQIVLNWTAPAGIVQGYNVYSGTVSGGETNPASVAGTSYTATGLTDGITYYFTVAAYNGAGQGPSSSEVAASPLAVTPANVVAAAGNGEVTLTWSAPAFAVTYNIYRATTPGGEGNSPYKTGIVSTSYVNSGLTNGVTYYYEITSVNAGGESARSAEVSAAPSSGLSFGAGLQLFSIPYDYPGVGLDSLFGYTGVKLAVWNPLSVSYAVTPTSPADEIRPGIGYWVRFPQSVTITAVGAPANTSQPFNVPLSAGWNQIGDPFTVSIPVTSLTFNNGLSTYAQATAGSPALIGAIYSYNAVTGQYDQLTAANYLNVDQGYWIWASANTNMQVTNP